MDTKFILLAGVPLLIGIFYLIDRQVKNKKMLNLVFGVIGALLFILMALWSFHMRSVENRVMLAAFIMFIGSMGTVSIVNLLLDRRTRLPFGDILLLLLYLPIFFLMGRNDGSLLSSAISISFFYITVGLLETFRPEVQLKHLLSLKIVLWLVFLIVGIVFRSTITI